MHGAKLRIILKPTKKKVGKFTCCAVEQQYDAFVVFLLPQVLRTLRLLSEDAFSVFQPHRSKIYRAMKKLKESSQRHRSGAGWIAAL